MGSIAVFIKLILKILVTYGVLVKVWAYTFGGMYFSILMYIIESGRVKSKIINWFSRKND